MEKFYFTLISANQQSTTIRNVEEVLFELEDIEAGCSIDYANRKRKSDEAGLFLVDFASTYQFSAFNSLSWCIHFIHSSQITLMV